MTTLSLRPISMRKKCLRTLYLAHRWLGLIMGVLMLSWCLSGIVMLWRPWPTPIAGTELVGHAPLLLSPSLPMVPSLMEPGSRFQSFRLGMVGAEPVLTLFPVTGTPFAVDLRTGQTGSIPFQEASASARAYAALLGVQNVPVSEGITTDDQWVLDTPAHQQGFERFRFPGPARLVVYVSPITGDVVQATDKVSRAWAWVGAIPHWLYPAVLRRHPPIWKTVVIVLSGASIFLTVTGLFIGCLCLRRRWPFSAYQRWHLVHHFFGMLFGILALSWITTGFLTMTPAGLFASNKDRLDPVHVTGSISGSELQLLLERIAVYRTTGWIDIRGVFLDGRIFLAVTDGKGHRERLDDNLTPTPLEISTLGQSARLLTAPDSYYFNRSTHPRSFPVIRLTADNGVLFYVDAQTGAVQAAFDTPARYSRWFVYGPHDINFLPWLRTAFARLWVVFPLLSGVFVLYLAGMVIGVRRFILLWRKTRSS